MFCGHVEERPRDAGFRFDSASVELLAEVFAKSGGREQEDFGDLAALRKRCDVVIVSMHNGVEYQLKPSQAQIAFAHAAIDAGAKLVIGHHPHVVQPSEKYRGGLIYYSLGNFVFDQYQREATQHGEVVQVSFLNREILETHVMRVKITASGPELE